MSSWNNATLVSASEWSPRQRANTNPSQSSSLTPGPGLLQGPLGIFWDIENCPVPVDVRSEDVAGNIRMALHHISEGAVTVFSAYGDFTYFTRKLREGCQQTGVKLVDVPNGHKDAADKAILLDMLLFAMDNRPPSTIMLISGDVDFAPALHVLNQRGYTVIIVIRSPAQTSPALKSAGEFVWDWPSLARGQGFVFPQYSYPPEFYMGEVHPHLETLVYNDIPRPQQCVVGDEYAKPSSNLSNGEVGQSSSTNLMRVQQQNKSNDLKSKVVNLLQLSGQMLPLSVLSDEYCMMYGHPLCASDYGASDIIHLLNMISDAVLIGGKGDQRIVYLPPSGTPSRRAKARSRKQLNQMMQSQNIDTTMMRSKRRRQNP